MLIYTPFLQINHLSTGELAERERALSDLREPTLACSVGPRSASGRVSFHEFLAGFLFEIQ